MNVDENGQKSLETAHLEEERDDHHQLIKRCEGGGEIGHMSPSAGDIHCVPVVDMKKTRHIGVKEGVGLLSSGGTDQTKEGVTIWNEAQHLLQDERNEGDGDVASLCEDVHIKEREERQVVHDLIEISHVELQRSIVVVDCGNDNKQIGEIEDLEPIQRSLEVEDGEGCEEEHNQHDESCDIHEGL